MTDPLKARVHLVLAVADETPFSFRTDVLCLTRDPEFVYKQALDAAFRSLLAIKQPAHLTRVLRQSIEWIPLTRQGNRG